MKRIPLAVSFFLFLLLAAGCQRGPLPTPTAAEPTIPSVSQAPPTAVIPTTAPTGKISTPLPKAPTATPTPQTPTTNPSSPTPQATPFAETPTTPPTTQPTSTQVAGAGCVEKAAFYSDVSVPDNTILTEGQEFVKTWQLRNVGTCTWGKDYALVFAGGAVLNAPLSVPLPDAAPGDIFEISQKMTAPSSGGLYTSLWEFQGPSGQHFGVGADGADLIWVKIAVKEAVGAETLASTGACPAQANQDYEAQVLALINGARQQKGLPALALQPQLAAAALAHSLDMACNNFVDHTGSDGSSWSDRVKQRGYTGDNVHENIYVGNPAFGGTPDGAFTWWMNSQIHRGNILNAKVSQVGIGYAFDANSDYGGYYTIDFARP